MTVALAATLDPSLCSRSDVTWLTPLKGQNQPWISGVKSMCQFRERGKIGLNQPLKYIHPFPPVTHLLFFAPLQLSGQKNLLGKKNIGGEGENPPIQIMPLLLFDVSTL